MALEPGSKLGPYEVLGPLGAGGMREVYRARDPKLSREVAVKVLPSEVARDPERLSRFRREATLIAALNHPHVLPANDHRGSETARRQSARWLALIALADRFVEHQRQNAYLAERFTDRQIVRYVFERLGRSSQVYGRPAWPRESRDSPQRA